MRKLHSQKHKYNHVRMHAYTHRYTHRYTHTETFGLEVVKVKNNGDPCNKVNALRLANRDTAACPAQLSFRYILPHSSITSEV